MSYSRLSLVVMLGLCSCTLRKSDDDDDGDSGHLDLDNSSSDARHGMYNYVPLGGYRGWEYVHELEPENLVVELNPPHRESGGWMIATLSYSLKDSGDLIGIIDWSSDSTDGVLIHGWSWQDDEEVVFEPPVVFANARMDVGQSVESESADATFVSTFVGVEDCPNHWITEVTWECVRVDVACTLGDCAEAPFLGTWWNAVDWGPSRIGALGVDDPADPWILTYANYNPG